MQKCEHMEGVHIYKNVARVRGALNICVSMHQGAGMRECKGTRGAAPVQERAGASREGV